MIIYVLLIIHLLIISLMPVKYDKVTVPISIGIMLFLGFFRGHTVGTDIAVYTVNFVNMTADPLSWNQGTEFEIGFNHLIVFFKTHISDEPMLFFGFIFLIFMFGVLYLFRKSDVRVSLCLFFLMTLGFYTMSFNIMRQLFGFGLICFCLPSLMKNKQYIFCMLYILLVAIFFHRMLYILLLIPVIEYFIKSDFSSKVFTKKNIIIILVLSLYIFYQADKVQSILVSLAANILQLNERYLMHLSALAQRDTSFFVTAIQTLFCGYVVIISPQVKNTYLLSYVTGVILTNILGAINPLFIRVGILLTFFAIIYFSYLWYNIEKYKTRAFFRLFVCIYSIIYIINSLIKNFGDVTPYINRLL